MSFRKAARWAKCATRRTPVVAVIVTALMATTLATGAGASTQKSSDTLATQTIAVDTSSAVTMSQVLRYQLERNGSVAIETSTGRTIGVVSKPWAKNVTSGKAVVRPQFSFWQVTYCTAAVVWFVGTSFLAVEAIKALGGVVMAVRLLLAAGSSQEKIRALLGVAGWVSGVQAVINNCLR